MAAALDFLGDTSNITEPTVVDYPEEKKTPGLKKWIARNTYEMCRSELREDHARDEYRQASNILLLLVPRSGGGIDIKGFAILKIVATPPSQDSDKNLSIEDANAQAKAAEAAYSEILKTEKVAKTVAAKAAFKEAENAAFAAVRSTKMKANSLESERIARLPIICAEGGRGYGKLLLDKVTQVARAAGKERIRLNAISDGLVEKVYGPYGYTKVTAVSDVFGHPDYPLDEETVMEYIIPSTEAAPAAAGQGPAGGSSRLKKQTRRSKRHTRNHKGRKLRKLSTRRR